MLPVPARLLACSLYVPPISEGYVNTSYWRQTSFYHTRAWPALLRVPLVKEVPTAEA